MPVATVENLTYRLFREDDLPGLLRLWEEAGWGTLTAEQWRTWFIETPNGSCLVMVAVDECGEVVAQKIFTPERVIVGNREVRALRMSAPIVRHDARRDPLRSAGHPVVKLLAAGFSAAAEQGFQIIYSLPDYGWLPFVRWMPRVGLLKFMEATYECRALPITGTGGRNTDGVTAGLVAQRVTEFGHEYEELWRDARESFPITCGAVRDLEWMRFKNGGRITLEVRDPVDNRLVGYSATKQQTGLIADLLARRPADLAPVLAATLRWFAVEPSSSFTQLKVMLTPALRAAVESLDAAHEDFRFAFIYHALDSSLPADLLASERWYIMPGD